MQIYPKRACLEGLEMEIFKLVSYSATPEQWQEWLRVPLEHATARGNLDLFNKLLGAGANGRAGWRGCRGRTLLDAAAVGGNEDIVSGLLRVGAQPDVNVVPCLSKGSALYTATVLGHAAVAKRLVVAGADVNVVDPVGSCILNEAIWGGHEKLVTDLLIAGADPNWRGGRIGAFPLHWAAAEGFDGIVSTLLLRGADKDALDQEGFSPLIVASVRGNSSVVKILLAADADTSIRDTWQNRSALDYAVREGHGDVVEAIVGHGADVNAVGQYQKTPLHSAASHQNVKAVDELVGAGANIEARTTIGHTPLHFASARLSREAAFSLLRNGADVNAQTVSLQTPLACAARNGGLEGATEMVDFLLRADADETVVDADSNKPADVVGFNIDVGIPLAEDVDRIRKLLANAPSDRAWRRRGCLVLMCRAHPDRLQQNQVISGTHHTDTGWGEVNVCHETAGGSSVDEIRVDGDDWAVVVAKVPRLKEEGVFRTIVGYL